MKTERNAEEVTSSIADLRRQLATAGEQFEELHREPIEAFRLEISGGIHDALSELKRDVAELSGDNPLCSEILILSGEYIDWLQWTFWDLPYFAVALRPDKPRFRRTVAACGLVFLAIRVLDDLVDRHFWYRGKRTTLLAGLSQRHRQGDRSEGLTVLTAMLLCFDGLSRLSQDLDPPGGAELASDGPLRPANPDRNDHGRERPRTVEPGILRAPHRAQERRILADPLRGDRP